MNGWMLAGGAAALVCAAGHAVAGRSMFYRPITSDLHDKLHAGLFTGIWHVITINFTLSGVALVVLSISGSGQAVAWLVSAQFCGYAAVYLAISLRLGGASKLFQWMPFGATAILSALGAVTSP